MRSAKKEILLAVEGDTDVDLFSNTLGLPRSNIISCAGKEVLMEVYQMGPQKGIDAGTVFVRDRDHDAHTSVVTSGVLLLVTDRYDIEMQLLEVRLFARMLGEYLKREVTDWEASQAFLLIAEAAGSIGALRLHSKQAAASFDFDDIKWRKFIDEKTLKPDLTELVRYMLAKSKIAATPADLVLSITGILAGQPAIDLVCGKDFIEVFQIALSRHYDACTAAECAPTVLARTIRIAATQSDLKAMTLYPALTTHVQGNTFPWTGNAL